MTDFRRINPKKSFMGNLIESKIYIEEVKSAEHLNTDDKQLVEKAIEAAKMAYAPYSNFNVGAAVLLQNGKTILGNNQENAAYPSGLCAERVALFAASAEQPKTPILAIAITAHSDFISVGELLSPCGSCRQVMVEYEYRHQNNIRILLKGDSEKVYIVNSAKDLLPFCFNPSRIQPK